MAQFYFTTNPPSDSIPLSFLSTFLFSKDNSLAILSMEKYVGENKTGLYNYQYSPPGTYITSASIGCVQKSITFGGVSTTQLTTAPVDFSVNVSNGALQFEFLNSTISLSGITQDSSGSCFPVVQNGMVWRLYQVPPSGTNGEPSWSWLTKAGCVPGDILFLGYTVPETFYKTNTLISASDVTKCQTKNVKEVTYPNTSNTLTYDQPMSQLKSITINGTVTTFSPALYPGQSNSIVDSIYDDARTIVLNIVLDPADRVEIQYTTYVKQHTYKGFKYVNASGQTAWYHCDLNPTYGRMMTDPLNTSPLPTSVALFQQVLFYLVPTCMIKLTPLTISGTPASTTISGNLTIDSAYNYGETHFLRHHIGVTTEVIDSIFAQQTGNFYNYWDETPFGQAEYDSQGPAASTSNIYSNYLPSMMPLAKVMMSGPGSVEGLYNTDVRQRGGGLLTDFNRNVVDRTGNANNVRNLWDLGNWPGKLYFEGGTVTVSMPSNILSTYTTDQVKEVVDYYLGPGIKSVINYE